MRSVYVTRRLQQIAFSCKRKLLQQVKKRIELMSSTSFLDVSQVHQESLEEEGCHL